MRWLRRLCVLPIRVYQRTLGVWKGATCRFVPTCSEYAAQAILKHGILRGVRLAIVRILKCQPFGPCGEDPVP